jgi:hypothetical protein
MAITQELRRKADNFLLSDIVAEWTPWYADKIAVTQYTVSNVAVDDRQGVMNKKIDVTFLFADHYPSSTVTDHYWLLEEADMMNRICTYKDSAGDVTDVKIEKVDTPDRIEEIRTKDLVTVKVTLRQLFYIPRTT